MKKTDTKITRFKDGDWNIDIIDGPIWEAWLNHFEYGVSVLMIGIEKKDADFNRFRELVESNLEEYKQSYMEEYGE